MFIVQNKKKAFVVYVDILAEPNLPFKRLKLDGLDSNKKYKREGEEKIYFGDELINIGLVIPRLHDFEASAWILKEVE